MELVSLIATVGIHTETFDLSVTSLYSILATAMLTFLYYVGKEVIN
jgi:ribose/xylose/arabinose/galactoside ABC-type transport system permease subunit